MQSINQPQAALLAGMQQGQNPMMQQGFMGGGLASLRPGYMGGGAIGGGEVESHHDHRCVPDGRDCRGASRNSRQGIDAHRLRLWPDVAIRS